jgi:hypothetical protein
MDSSQDMDRLSVEVESWRNRPSRGLQQKRLKADDVVVGSTETEGRRYQRLMAMGRTDLETMVCGIEILVEGYRDDVLRT